MTSRTLFTAAFVGLLVPASVRSSDIVYPAYGETESTSTFAGLLVPAPVRSSSIVIPALGVKKATTLPMSST